MDNLIQKLEQLVSNQVEEFQKSPIKQGLKILLMIYVIKQIIKWSKEDGK